ncbi:MAG: NTP transferase domain-containing protein [Desulfobacterales bacterium]|nr:NTP transferase domain-containing protein [Desulfobacterales bacterium]
MEPINVTASVIMAAGRGSRMKEFKGNKTLLPLKPNASPFEGNHPILLHILDHLPPGPKAVVVNHEKQAVIDATKDFELTYCLQPELNGTGGALLAARTFLEKQICDRFIITMGDVPLVKRQTYVDLARKLDENQMIVLGFCPADKKEYGVLETEGRKIKRIIESKYWKKFPIEKQSNLKICNSGIYAVRKDDLLTYLTVLEKKPHLVHKQVDDRIREIKEYFITDLIEYMYADGLSVGYTLAEDEMEVMGVDDITALQKAQKIFQENY